MLKTILIALALQFRVGYAAYYDQGVMEQVVEVRQAGWTAGSLPKELPSVVGFVAVVDCHRIGERVWLFHPSEGFTGPYLVADCANQVEGHHVRMKERGIVVEVDWNTAVRWDIVGRGPEVIWVGVVSRE